MIVRFVIWSTVLCLCLRGCKAEVTVQNRAYHDVSISFAPNVAAEDGKLLLDSFRLQGILDKTSRVLYKAIGLRIANAVIHLPRTWDLSTWENVTALATQRQATPSDIVVDATVDSAFGKYPISLQHGGCGVTGHPITVPVDFLKDTEDDANGKLVAREWLKYRYGVFDENGFEDDNMYPSTYTIPGTTELQVTECTDPQLQYIFKDDDGNNCTEEAVSQPGHNCTLVPEEEVAEQVKSSLMYFHPNLLNVEEVCGRNHSHNNASPNKHNLLCSGKSVWDVLHTSADFRSDETVDDYVEPTFFFTQEDHPRVVVAWEDSDHLSNQKKSILFGIQRFFYDLPEHSEFGLYSFNDDLNRVRPLSELPPPDARQETISSDFISEDNICSTCAVAEAMAVLLSDSYEGSVILIVGSSSSEVNDSVIETLRNSQICLTVIVFADEDSVADSYEGLRVASPCGAIIRIPHSEPEGTSLGKLYGAMQTAVPQSPSDVKTITVESGVMSWNNPISIPTEPTAREFHIWLARPLNTASIVCKDGDNPVTLTTQIKTSIASYSFDPVASGVSCSLKTDKLLEVLTQVQMTTKPGEYFDADVWFWDTTPEQGTDQMPVIIYAKVNFGKYPIRYAKVYATVKSPEGSDVKVQLLDTGLGDPDVTQNDGIYSGYFMDFDAKGDYQVQVTIDDYDGQAKMGKNGAERCCGSLVKSEQFDSYPFQKTLQASFTAIGAKPVDGYKPSRVTDLSVEEFDPPRNITLKWTSPGGGKASRYEFFLFCETEECEMDGKLPRWIEFKSPPPMPKSQGEAERIFLKLSVKSVMNLTVIFAITAVTGSEVFADVSNHLQVKFTVSPGPRTTMDPTIKEPVASPGDNVGLIVGCVIVIIFLLLCIAAVIRFYIMKPRSPPTESMTPISNHDNANCGAESSGSFKAARFNARGEPIMRRVESFPVVLYTHDQLRDLKNKNTDPPLYGPEMAAKPWMSLDALPRIKSKVDETSENSASTVEMNDIGLVDETGEMKQLDDISQTSLLHSEEIAKF